MFSTIGEFVTLMNAGGWVMWVLFVLNLALWYGLGYRYLMLRRGTEGSVRRLVAKHQTRGKEQPLRGLLDYAVADAVTASDEAEQLGLARRDYVEGALFPYMTLVGRYATLVGTIVMLAPLIGLLGTVIGMIETFDALQTGSVFSQASSISGGISKALYTTELGLVVSVPGLIIGKILDKQEERYELDFEQIADVICTKDEL